MNTLIARALLLPLLLSGTPSQDAKSAASAATPARHRAIEPAERASEPWWKERFEQANQRIARGDVGLIFLGDSITQGWEGEGRDVWAEFYGKRKALNLGFSGDRTQHVLWRLEHHGLELLARQPADQATPRLVVLMIGTNNSNGDDNTAQEIADGISAVVESLGARLPQAKVLVLGIFPRNETADAQRAKNAQASLLAARCADGKRVHYLDIGSAFLGPDGSLTREVMPDFLHLSAAGYRRWAEAIEPKLRELLGE